MGPGEIRLRGVSRRFRLLTESNKTLKETLLRRRRTVSRDLWVLRDVDLDIARGEAVGLVGRNGIGKSTTLRLVAGIIPPHSGTVETGGRVASLLELGAGFHPDFTGAENVILQAALYGLSEREATDRLEEIVAFAELEEFIGMPVKNYSSGMFMRLGFSIAAHVDADVMLVDEVLAVGDAAFQRKCLGRIAEYRRRGGTLLFVSHDQGAVEQICERAVLIDDGHVVADGTPTATFAEYNRRTVSRGGPAAAGEPAEAPGYGSLRVRIRGHRLLGPEGASDRFGSGDPLVVEIDLEPDGVVETAVVGVDLHAANGVHLFGTNSRGDGFALEGLDAPRTVTFTVPELPLLEGRFLLTLSVRSGDESEVYHHLDSCAELSVFPQSPGFGPVRVQPHWSMSSSADAPVLRR